MIDIYGGKDPRSIPSYSAGDAARYLNIPTSTIRSWTIGRKYKVTDGKKHFEPIINTEIKNPLRLTFINLIEIHILRAIRQHHQIDLVKVRTALDYIDEQFQIPHPLARHEFFTDGIDLFIEHYGNLINASSNDQTTLRNSLKEHLKRVESDSEGLAMKLFPFTRNHEEKNPRLVVIDPCIAFGRMVIVGSGIPTDVIAERFHAGDSHAQLAQDYECDIEKIEEAIRCETRPIAA
jgi:uncharacterized protein (DUF433 family)